MTTHIYFEIQADDTSRAIGFYSDVFGWQFEKAQALPIDYWHIASQGLVGGLLKRPAKAPTGPCGTNAFVCSFQVADIDKTTSKILSLGGVIAMPKFAVPGKCWQGYFIDPEGNTLGVFQVDESAK